jgi:nucleoside 2-deoxyribosyltransferase
MIVTGGLYRERCISPEWNHLYGSGGRAAAALSGQTADVELITYCEPSFLERATLLLGLSGVRLRASPCRRTIDFHYFHPLSQPDMFWTGDVEPPIDVAGEIVLRFGMLEGEARASADVAVFDPQSSNQSFRANGSTAGRLATILNTQELRAMAPGLEPAAAVRQVLADAKDDLLVVKRGAHGAAVYSSAGLLGEAPVYRSGRVFKIGSGDVFSAAYTLYWAVEGRDPVESADLASRAVAHYVASRSLPLPPVAGLVHGEALPQMSSPGQIYLAGPFFSLGERWVVEEARTALLSLGCKVFSPLHEVGSGPPNVVAPRDLAGLDTCTAVLAILNGGDPGTLFEVGHARLRGIPVVGLAENIREHDVTMPLGTGCEIVDDFATAVYRAAWAAMR